MTQDLSNYDRAYLENRGDFQTLAGSPVDQLALLRRLPWPPTR